MKQIILLFIASLMMLPLAAQQVDTIPEANVAPEPEDIELIEEMPVITEEPVAEEDSYVKPSYADTTNVVGRVEVIETPESTRVTLGQNEVFIVEENGDTVRVVLGSRGISIVEGQNGTEVKVIDMGDLPKDYRHKPKKFRPHFAGLEVGLNNYVTPDFSMSLPPDEAYMNLNTGKSWNWNINVIDYGFGLGTDFVGIGTGLGFEFTNYNFEGQNSIRKDPVTGATVEYVPDYAGNITKSKFNMTYMYAPLLLEFQIPAGSKRIHVSGGVIGGVKLWSNTKMKYKIADQKSKEKAKGDYNLAPLRWGFTARVGYRIINLYANYYMTSLFKEAGGPELYPFTVGLVLIPW